MKFVIHLDKSIYHAGDVVTGWVRAGEQARLGCAPLTAARRRAGRVLANAAVYDIRLCAGAVRH